MGVTSIVVAVNKMDLVGYEHATFEELAGGVRAAAARLGIDEVTAIPVSAVTGANVIDPRARRHALVPRAVGARRPDRLGADCRSRRDAPFRLPVQMIVRASGNFRGYAGTIATGEVRPGDEVVVADSGVPRQGRPRS